MELNARNHFQAVPPPEIPPFQTRPFSVMGVPFECPERYQLLQAVGQGAYGIVCSAHDTLTGERVAIKKIAAVADNTTDCKRTLREMRLLRHFHHDNVIALKDIYIPHSHGYNFQDVYTVTELMDTDLHQVIESHQQLTDEHVQYFAYQILRALKHINSANVFRRDLKPSNILLNSNCDLKICDFGLARVVPEFHERLTAYVTTRWYRAPEIMMSQCSYTNALDMWSVGCILGEIVRKQPLFPGVDHVQQMKLVTDVVGSPSETEIASFESEAARNFLREHVANKRPKPLTEVFPNTPPLLRDLLGRMLVFNPHHRITIDEALRHPYLEPLYTSDDEQEIASPFEFEFDRSDVIRETLKRAIWEEAQSYRYRAAE